MTSSIVNGQNSYTVSKVIRQECNCWLTQLTDIVFIYGRVTVEVRSHAKTNRTIGYLLAFRAMSYDRVDSHSYLVSQLTSTG